MKSVTFRLSAILVLTCIVAFSGVILWRVSGQQADGGKRPPARQPAPGKMLVESSVPELLIESVTDFAVGNHRRLRVTVANTTNKNLVDYAFLLTDGSTTTSSGATTGWTLAPGQKDVITLPFDSHAEGVPILFAAVFEDGTAAGDREEVSRMKDYRLAVLAQFERASQLFRKAKGAPAATPAAAVLQNLEQGIAALPEPPASQDVTPGTASGLQHGKEFIRTYLMPAKGKLKVDAASNALVIRDNIDGALSHIEKALAKGRFMPR